MKQLLGVDEYFFDDDIKRPDSFDDMTLLKPLNWSGVLQEHLTFYQNEE